MASAEICASYGGKRFTNESHRYVPSGESFIPDEGNKLSSNKCALSDFFSAQEQLSLSDFSSIDLVRSKPSKDATLDFLLENFCSTGEKSNEKSACIVENADLATDTFSLNNLYRKEELKTCSETASEQSNSSDFSFLECVDVLPVEHIDASENNSSNNLTNFFFHCDIPSTEADSLNSSVQEDVPAVESDGCQSDDLGFSLAGLYVSKKERTESLSEQSTLSNLSESGKLSLSDELQLEALYSDSSSESGYISEKEKQTVDGIDLGLAKGHIKNISLDLRKESECVPVQLSRRAFSVSKKDNHVKSRPSLFCRVLGHKAQINNTPSIISPPSDLIDYLESRNYWKYFSFDSPSPDDIVNEKQKNVFHD